MARVLIVGGGCRGRWLAAELVREGHLVRMTARSEERRAAIESSGAEFSLATPARIGTLRPAIEGVTIACWLLACAHGGEAELGRLHGAGLELFVRQLIDTAVRGFLYDASPGALPEALLAQGERAARSVAALNAIPMRVLAHAGEAGPGDGGWVAAARREIVTLLEGSGGAARGLS